MKTPTKILLDTNVLISWALQSHSSHSETRRCIKKLLQRNGQLFYCIECLVEASFVLTRPLNKGGYALNAYDLDRFVHMIKNGFLRIDVDYFEEWENFVKKGIIKQDARDSQIAAIVLSSGIDALLSYNERDFIRFGVNVLHPDTIT